MADGPLAPAGYMACQWRMDGGAQGACYGRFRVPGEGLPCRELAGSLSCRQGHGTAGQNVTGKIWYEKWYDSKRGI